MANDNKNFDFDPKEEEIGTTLQPIWIGKCGLTPLSDDREDFYGIVYGFMQGLYATENYPISSGCLKCKQMAMPFANL